MVVQIPGSLSHIANPVTYGAGTIGWRTPGVRFTQLVPVDDMKLELAVEAVKNKWSQRGGRRRRRRDPDPGRHRLRRGLGHAHVPGAAPSWTARPATSTYMAYLVGVYDKIDLNGFGDGVAIPAWATGKTSIDRQRHRGRRQARPSPRSPSPANFYTGKTTGNMLGSQLVFGDVKDTGYWVQLAGNFTKELSLNVAYGADTPDKADIRRVGRQRRSASRTPSWAACSSTRTAATPWASSTGRTSPPTPPAPPPSTDTDAMQVIATAAYFF